MTTAKKRTMRNYLENEGLKLIIWVSNLLILQSLKA